MIDKYSICLGDLVHIQEIKGAPSEIDEGVVNIEAGYYPVCLIEDNDSIDGVEFFTIGIDLGDGEQLKLTEDALEEYVTDYLPKSKY